MCYNLINQIDKLTMQIKELQITFKIKRTKI